MNLRGRISRMLPDIAAKPDEAHRVGVVDVGSNTVRFVAYDTSGRVPQPIFNERVFCGLGANLEKDGRLGEDAMDLAVQTIHRFATLASRMSIERLDIIGTAAVREAKNSDIFIERVLQESGHSLRVITGADEARYSALGVRAGIEMVNGLVGDLGGGSLELVGVRNNEIGPATSLPLGTLRLNDTYAKNADKAEKIINSYLDELGWLTDYADSGLYAVGGAWRNIARAHLQSNNYPIRILHQYEISGAAMGDWADKISKMSPVQALELPAISRKRAPNAPIAAFVLIQLMKRLRPKTFTVSALGLREGVIYDQTSDSYRSRDALIEACLDAAQRHSRFPEHGADLMTWIDPLFDGEAIDRQRLRYAACLLSDVAWNGHPEYRAERAMEFGLETQLNDVTHWGRAFISMALFTLYGGGRTGRKLSILTALLSDADIEDARRIGLALRLGQRLSGGTKELLDETELRMDADRVYLRVKRDSAYLLSESVEKRLQALSKAFGRSSAIEID